MGWDSAKKVAEKTRSSGIFTRLENDGDWMLVAFLGEPEAKEVHWIGGTTQVCDGDGCQNCKKYGPPQAKFSINVYVKSIYASKEESDVEEIRIFQQGSRWFNDLLAADEEYGLTTWWFKIKRKGKANSKKTTYSILPAEKFTPEEKKTLAKLALLDLTGNNDDDDDDNDDDDDDDDDKKPAKKSSQQSSSKKDDDTPKKKPTTTQDSLIDPEDAQVIVEKLKAGPREKLNEFLDKFAVKRIKDLKASQKEAAMKFLGVDAKKESNESGDEEVDPFG